MKNSNVRTACCLDFFFPFPGFSPKSWGPKKNRQWKVIQQLRQRFSGALHLYSLGVLSLISGFLLPGRGFLFFSLRSVYSELRENKTHCIHNSFNVERSRSWISSSFFVFRRDRRIIIIINRAQNKYLYRVGNPTAWFSSCVSMPEKRVCVVRSCGVFFFCYLSNFNYINLFIIKRFCTVYLHHKLISN